MCILCTIGTYTYICYKVTVLSAEIKIRKYTRLMWQNQIQLIFHSYIYVIFQANSFPNSHGFVDPLMLPCNLRKDLFWKLSS